MEATRAYRKVGFDALESDRIEPIVVHARHVKQIKGRKTDVANSVRLARICQFGLRTPRFVPSAKFRHRRKLLRQHSKDQHKERNRSVAVRQFGNP